MTQRELNDGETRLFEDCDERFGESGFVACPWCDAQIGDDLWMAINSHGDSFNSKLQCPECDLPLLVDAEVSIHLTLTARKE